MEDQNDHRTTLGWIALYLLVSAWSMWWLWGPEIPPGMDTTGHLVRVDTAFSFFSQGHLDGWMDRNMLGYQLHLAYGPGFAVMVGAVKVLSLGTFSTVMAYKVTAILATVAIPFAGMFFARALGLKANAAWLAGLLMLGVSSFKSSGLEGAFLMGLMPQQVATPLVLVAWALTIRARPRPVLLGAVVATLTVTHPYSTMVFVGFIPFILGIAHFRKIPIRWIELTKSAVIAIVLTTWWWLPTIANRDIKGPLTRWIKPTLPELLWEVANGKTGVPFPVSIIVLASFTGILVLATKTRNRGIAALAIGPLAMLLGAYVLVFVGKTKFPEVNFFSDRSVPFALYAFMPAAGLVFTRLHRYGATVAITFLVLALPSLTPPQVVMHHPSIELNEIAYDLATVVKPGYRYAFADAPRLELSVPEVSRYLGWKAMVGDISIFGQEWAPGSKVSFGIYDPLNDENIDTWVETMRDARVSHLVSADPQIIHLFTHQDILKPISQHGELALWEITGPRQVEITASAMNQLQLIVHTTEPNQIVELPISYSRGWASDHFTLGRAESGRLTIQLPEGSTPVELNWQLPRIHTIAWLITFIGVTIMAIYSARPSRINQRLRQNLTKNHAYDHLP